MPKASPESSQHAVAVIGGATAGAELAGRLAQRGALVAVFEQNPRPYGKIEDGLPRWHEGLRQKEYQNIGEKLSHPGIHYIPNTKVGRDLDFRSLVEDWGFEVVVLACGAWNDRPLPIDGADAYVGKGLVYQNPFVIAFNHGEDPAYQGPIFAIEDDAIVIGGGLASIDVAKIHTLETTRAKLAKRGIDVSTTKLEVSGIPKFLKGHGLGWDDLGLAGCTIFYRRRAEDMPLVSIPDDAPPERVEKIYQTRKRMLDKAMTKYCFRVEPLASPSELIVEDGRLVGLRFRRNRMEDGRPVATDEEFERRAPYVVSSIGSIPEPIEGIDQKGELFAFTDWDYGRLDGYPSVYSAGNVVTGKGNIVESRKHATFVSAEVAAVYLGLSDEAGGDSREAQLTSGALSSATVTAAEVIGHLESQTTIAPEALEELARRIRKRQDAVGYPGDFKAWIESLPAAP